MRKLLTGTLIAAGLGIGTTPLLAEDHVVEMANMLFSPDNLEIAVGDTVTFINLEPVPHTATADDGSFDTGRLGRDESVAITFDQAGEFSYICILHPMMTGTIVVQ